MSRIGIIDVDGHAKKKKWGATIYPNLALCKISAWQVEEIAKGTEGIVKGRTLNYEWYHQ